MSKVRIKGISEELKKELLTSDDDAVFKYAEAHPQFIADFDSAKGLLADIDINKELKIETLEYIFNIVSDEEKERVHTRGYKFDIENVYKNYKYKTKIFKKDFISLYNSISNIAVDKYYPDPKTSEIYNLLCDLCNNREKQLECLSLLLQLSYSKQVSFKDIAVYFSNSIDKIDENTIKVSNIFKKVKGNLRLNIFKTLCRVLSDPFNNDLCLENKVIYNILKDGEDYEQLIIFEPTPFFVQKLYIDSKYNSSEITFVFNNPIILKLIKDTIDIEDRFRFITFEELSILPVRQKAKIMYFANHIQNKELLRAVNYILVSRYDCFSFLILDSDNNVTDPGGYIQEMICENNYSNKQLFILPVGIKNEGVPKRKTLLEFTNSMDNLSCLLSNYSLRNIDEKQYIYSIPRTYEISVSDLLKGNLRSYFRKEELNYNRKTDQSRERANVYHYSSYIDICYSIYSDFRVKAYIRKPAKTDDDISSIIENTVKVKRCRDVEEARRWVENEYIFDSKKTKKGISSIRDEVASDYRYYLADAAIDLNTALCIYPEMDDIYDSNTFFAVERMITENEIGKVKIDYLTLDYVYTAAEEMSKKNEISIYQIIKVVSLIIDYAINNKNAKSNPLKEYLDDIDDNDNPLKEIRSALAQRSFSTEVFKKLIDYCRSKINKGNIEYLGVLIKALIPLNYDEICALTINDIKRSKTFNPDNKIVYFDVYRRIKENRNGIYMYVPLRRDEHYRKVVLPSIVSRYIDAHIEKIKSNHQNLSDEQIKGLSLLEGKSAYINNYQKILTPLELSKLCRKVLKEIRCTEEIIKVFDEQSGYFYDDLSEYKGDFLASNIKYYLYAEDICNFNISEYNYYVGNKQSKTFARNYVDFECDGSLFKLYLKLNNLERVLLGENSYINGNINFKDNISYKGNDNATYSYMTSLNYKPSGHDDVISIKNDNGFDIVVSKRNI